LHLVGILFPHITDKQVFNYGKYKTFDGSSNSGVLQIAALT